MISADLSRTHLFACFAAVCLVAAACGGGDAGDTTDDGGLFEAPESDDVGDSDDADVGSSESGATGAGGDVEVPGPKRSTGDNVEFDEDALSTHPLDRSVLTYFVRQREAPPVQPVVDTCAVLSTAEVDAIANELAVQYSLGQDPSFTSTPRGAACDYRSDTHLITLLIGASDEVPSDPLGNDAFLPPFAGDVSTTAWEGDASVVILSEDSIGLEVPYGALTTAGDYGVRVDNTGGTGIDYGYNGELYAELAAIAVANIGSAPAPSTDEVDLATLVGDPCSIWTADELEAFFMGSPVGDPTQPDGPNSCSWNGLYLGGVSVSARIFGGSNAYSIDSMETVGSAGSVYTFIGGGSSTFVVVDDNTQVGVRIEVLDGSIPDDAAIALAENMAMRVG